MKYEYAVIPNIEIHGDLERAQSVQKFLNEFGETGYRLVHLLQTPGATSFTAIFEREST